MGNPQHTKFRSVEEMLDFLPEHEREMVEILRDIIFEIVPNVVEKLAYNVPFYYHPKRICFIWPSSVPWGNLAEGVCIGFMERNGKGKVRGRIVFRSASEIDKEIIAMEIMETLGYS